MPAPISAFVDVTTNVAGASTTKFSFGTLMFVAPQTVNVDRQNGPFFSIAELNTAGFTSVAEPETNAWATAAFAQPTGVDSVLIGTEAVGDADMTATLDAIEAAGSDTWYNTNMYSRVTADIEDMSAWIEARKKISIVQSSEAAILAGTPANVALDLQTAGYLRTALLYYQTDTDYADGSWSSIISGMNLDAPDGAGIAAFQVLPGIASTEVTGAQATEIYDANANLYGRTDRVATSFTAKGTMAAGAPTFIDVTISLDWVEVRTQEAIIAAFVRTKTKIPYTNAGIAIIGAEVKGVLDSGVTNGIISPDTPIVINLPDVNAVSDADKAARVLTLSASFTLAGAIQRVVLTYNVQF